MSTETKEGRQVVPDDFECLDDRLRAIGEGAYAAAIIGIEGAVDRADVAFSYVRDHVHVPESVHNLIERVR